MVRQLLGNIRGPMGPDGERGPQGPPGADGSDVELQPFDGRNFIEVTDKTDTSNGSVERINGTDVFTGTDSNTTTHILYPNEYKLKEGKTYVISYDYYSETIANCDNIWIINTDGSHSNYSIHPENRHDYTNIYNIPLGEEIRCYVVFKPPYDLIGTLRIGSNRNDGDTGPLEIKNVSLSEGYDISYKPKSYPVGWNGHQIGGVKDSSNFIENSKHFTGTTNTGEIIVENGINKYSGSTYVEIEFNKNLKKGIVYMFSWWNEGNVDYNQIQVRDGGFVLLTGTSLIEKEIVNDGRSYILFSPYRDVVGENIVLRVGNSNFDTHKSSMYCLNETRDKAWQPSEEDLLR